MDLERREQVLRDLAAGGLTFRDFAGLKKRDIDAIAHLGRVAFESKKFDQAARIFQFLEGLESDRPEYLLYQAECFAAGGQKAEAIAAIDRWSENEVLPPGAHARALLLKAQLLADTNRTEAAANLRFAKMLAERSEAAAEALKEAGL